MIKNEPIRVAHVIGKMCAGGVESVAFNYYKHMNHSLVQFDFFYDADSIVLPPQELLDMGARFIKVSPYQKVWRYVPELFSLFRRNNYRIVHSHLNALSIFPLFAAWLAGVPVRIAHSHSVPGGTERGKNTLKMILKHFSKLFATDFFSCSEKAGRWLFGDKCFDSGKVKIINNAIDRKYFHRLEETNNVRQDLSLENKFVVGHVGRFAYAKNHEFLIDIFLRIKARIPNAVLLLVGDGELREEIKNYIAVKHLTDSVIMTGSVSDPERYYQVFDVFIFPSHYEGLGMALVEAQVSGVPCVSSDVIPSIACVSNCCRFMSLSEDAAYWAETAISIASQKVDLVPSIKMYNILENAKKLQTWYVSKDFDPEQ